MKITPMTWGEVNDIVGTAKDKAELAVRDARRTHQDFNPKLKTGFAYVIIKTVPLTPFVKGCIEHGVGHYDKKRRILIFSNPGGFSGRATRIYVAGAKAFADVLGEHGIEYEIDYRRND